MWIRLPNPNAIKTPAKTGIAVWIWRVKLAFAVSCSLGTLALWIRNSHSQDLISAKAESSNSPTAQPIPAHPTAREVGTQILKQALLESVWGQPTMCEVRQMIQHGDKKRSGFGKYVRGGKGNLELRMSLQIPAGNQMNSLLQVSDGQLLTTLVSIGDQSSMSQVDLVKVREPLTITRETLQDPVVAMYLALGGQAELLRTYCQKYDWVKVTEGALGDHKVWFLRGVAIPQPLGPVARSTIDKQLFDSNIASKIPPNVRLAIGTTDSPNPFWLFQVETWSEEDDRGQGKSYVFTEWDSPVRLNPQQITSTLFKLPADPSIAEVRDETPLYIPPTTVHSASSTNPQAKSR